MIEKFTENETSEKSRRSLVALALATLLIANVEIVSDRLNILGLEFLISQERLVALGQIATLVLLTFFILRSSGEVVDAIKKLRLSRLEEQHLTEFQKLSAEWGFDDHEPSANGYEEDFKYLKFTTSKTKAMVENRFNTLITFFQILQVTALNYGFPIILGGLAIFHPQSLSNAVGFVSGTCAECFENPAINE